MTVQGQTAAEYNFPFPSPKAGTPARWTGTSFSVGGGEVRILNFGAAPSGWTDDLTSLHEETAGRDHYIDVASRAHALREVRRLTRGPAPVVLEVGSSSGYLLEDLRAVLPHAQLIGSDYTLGTLEALGRRMPDMPLLRFDLTQCPLPDSSVDVAVLINVLEHIEDDEAALANLYRILRPGGAAVIEVPAGSQLFDSYDKELMHFRRYDMPELERKLGAAGFEIVNRSHLGFLLYPAFWLSKKVSRARGAKKREKDASHVEQSIRASRRIGGLGDFLMRFEDGLRARIYLPRGIRCLVTCRKPAAAGGI